MIHIVEKLLLETQEQLTDKNIIIEADMDAKEYFAKKGFSAELGARVMSRVIQEEVKTPLTDEILFGQLQNGGIVKLSMKDEKLHLEFISATRDSDTQT